MFPAPAGINRVSPKEWFDAQGVPRASGDKPTSIIFSTSWVLCSPRQRG
ncbi:hypothetical protein AC23_5084 [Escherichia coli 7-233-03_S3_C2]|nr:hypothetical protein AC23_5084 [Escherichia coli 7-233-03_S3_C2]